MRFVALLGLLPLLAATQDDARVRELIDRLQSDDPKERLRAATELAAMGEAARPAMEKLRQSADPELRAQAEEILRKIDRQRTLGEYLAAPKRVTASFRNAPAAEVFAELERQTGYRIFVSPPQDLRLSAEFKDTPFLRALHEVCAASSELWPDPPKISDLSIQVRARPPERGPRAWVRQYAIGVLSTELSLTRDFLTGKRHGSLNLQVEVLWEPRNRPAAGQIEITAIEDEKGNSLVNLIQPSDGEPMTLKGDSAQAVFEVELSGPQLNLSALSILRGRVKLMYPIDIEAIRIAPAGDRTCQPTEGGEIEISLQHADKDHANYRIRVTGRVFSFMGIHVVDKAGKTHEGTVTDHSTVTRDLKFNLKPSDIKEFVVTRVKEFYTDQVEFEFKNIPLEP